MLTESTAAPTPPGTDGILVRGGHVLTSSPNGDVRDGAVRIVGETIDAVGRWEELRERYPRDEVRGGANDIVMPGLVNTHGHFSEGLLAGIAEQYTLWEWANAVIGPVGPCLTEEMAYVGTLVAGVQMLRSGITVSNDMFVCHPYGDPVTPGVVRALDEIGLRGEVSFGAVDVNCDVPISRIMDEHAALADAAAASRLSRFRVGVAGITAQTPAMLERTVRLAVDGGHGVHIHLQEIREEVTQVRREFDVSPVERCAMIGLFAAPTIAAHCVWVDARDREVLAEHAVSVAHNPISNMILASGVCPVPELRRLGIAVGIGVDGAASNDRQDMLEALKMTVLLQRVDRLQATTLRAREALEMATLGGARAIGLDAMLGSLEPRKAADLVVLDGASPALANVHDPYQAVVYCAGPREVKEVWVAGRRSVADGEAVLVDPGAVSAMSRPLAIELVRQAGLGSLSLLAR